jgi:uncharacterized membrane protein SpoIIM required for sporulation
MLTLKSVEFRREREDGWRELEHLLWFIQHHGIRSLAPEAVERLPALYRSALSSLSVARSIALDRALVQYLDNLALRSFLAVYSQPLSAVHGVLEFLGSSLPRAVRALRKHFAIAVLALVLGALSGFALVNADEGWFPVIVPTGLAGGRGPASTREELLRVLSVHQSSGVALLNMANYLFSNNTLVSLLIFATGFFGGAPTLLLTMGNGLVLGAFLALHYHRGLLGEFTGWVSIHGVTELTAILLFAAAGIRLGELILFPGALRRTDALSRYGPVAGQLAAGGVLLLLVAAVLEGVLRQTVIDTNQRLTIGFATLAVWIVWFSLAGRRKPASDDSQ